MYEIGIDSSHQHSKTLDEISDRTFDLAVTLCDNAHKICPSVSCAKRTLHKCFPDPRLTPGGEEEILNGYRDVRDRIAAWLT